MSTTLSPAPLRARGGYAKGRAKQEQIIQAAIELFGEVGFHGASLRDISARAGISHPGLLHHFTTKAELLAAVLAHRDEVDQAALDADRAAGHSYFEAMTRLVEQNQQRRALVELFAALSAESTSPNHPAHGYFVERYRDVAATMESEFAALEQAGQLRVGADPAPEARALIALMDGLQVQWLLSLDNDSASQLDMASDIRAHLATVLR